MNTGGAYAAEDVTAAAFEFRRGNARHRRSGISMPPEKTDVMTFIGSEGELPTPIFSDTDVVVTRGGRQRVDRGAQPASRAPALDPDDR